MFTKGFGGVTHMVFEVELIQKDIEFFVASKIETDPWKFGNLGQPKSHNKSNEKAMECMYGLHYILPNSHHPFILKLCVSVRPKPFQTPVLIYHSSSLDQSSKWELASTSIE
jgi:hypothetical protein